MVASREITRIAILLRVKLPGEHKGVVFRRTKSIIGQDERASPHGGVRY
jgi:hypothetical protein